MQYLHITYLKVHHVFSREERIYLNHVTCYSREERIYLNHVTCKHYFSDPCDAADHSAKEYDISKYIVLSETNHCITMYMHIIIFQAIDWLCSLY